MTLSAQEARTRKQAPAVEGVLPVFHQRWSPRSFADRPVDPADLARVFEAARWAASSNNEQPWSYLVGTRGSATYDRIFSALVEFNQMWAKSAPVLILGVAHTTFSRNGRPNNYALYDLGAASSYLTLEATVLGLAAHQMGGFNHDIARAALEIPDTYALGSVIALGYQGEPADLPNEKYLASEQEPRTRKPLKEFVFSAWETPASFL